MRAARGDLGGRGREDRLLTLTGPGGVGKTRLAIEVARASEPHFPDGAWFVPLASLRRSEDVPMAMVRALDAVTLDGESPEQALHRFLSARRLLLVVDNCEHLSGVAAFAGGLLEACPGLTVLATSREPLNLRAEARYPVPLAVRCTTDDAVDLVRGTRADARSGDWRRTTPR